MNGLAFKNLRKLQNVWLWKNECIDEDFETETGLASMPRTVTKKCGFDESETV